MSVTILNNRGQGTFHRKDLNQFPTLEDCELFFWSRMAIQKKVDEIMAQIEAREILKRNEH
jgi:hypothetical protein